MLTDAQKQRIEFLIEEVGIEMGLLDLPDLLSSEYYAELKNIGVPAIPFILHAMENEVSYWYYFLQDMLNIRFSANPFIAYDIFIEWGRNQGYL